MAFKSIKPDTYLEGPKSRGYELLFTFKVFRQFIRAFRKLHFVGPCVTVFGSARFKEEHHYYKLAYEIGREVSKAGFTIMTGGGPGIMEGANRGAFENGGISIGCNIKLPKEQTPNPYMHHWVTIDHFFVRKVLLLKYSYAFIVLPGGWGTMDELFETLTLIQTGIIHNFPIVLMGTDYFQKLMDYLHYMVEERTISASDLQIVKLTDNIVEAQNHIQEYITDFYKIRTRKKPIWWLFEKV